MVPVLDKNKQPLMPTTERRARKLMEQGKAKPYYYKTFFCIIIQVEPKSRFKQDVALAIDPGSKMCGLTVKSTAHTLLNIQYAAKTKIKDKVGNRAEARRKRRRRNVPYRKCRFNRKNIKSWLSPSTKARWQQHLNMIKFCAKMYPITHVAMEDIKAETIKGARCWNVNFSPIEYGKNWCYEQIKKDFKLTLYQGYDTYLMRNELCLTKGKEKLKVEFKAHCVDSWTMANDLIGGHTMVDNERLTYLKPLNFFRRQLQEHCPAKKGIRRPYGGTISLGIKKGTLVKHPKYMYCMTGGTTKGRITLHYLEDNKRLCQNANVEDITILTNLKWNVVK
jgi:RRXRR protein